MSIHVQENTLVSKELTFEREDILEEKCCEIYITRQRLMIFNCTLCNTVSRSFVSFVGHVLQEHFVEQECDNLGKICTEQDTIYENSDPSNSDVVHISFLDAQEDCMLETSLDEFIAKSPQYTEPTSPEIVEIVGSDLRQKELEKLFQIAVGIYACDQCDRVYKNNRQLQMHHRSHDCADRKYKCEQCGFAFKDNGNLRHHIRRYHSQEKHYCCTECPKKFYGRSELEAHLRLHTGERPYICTTCGKTYSHLSTLNKHNMTHTGHRPCVCKLCGKGFRTSSRLKDHLAVHTGDRTRVCSVCGTSFVRAKTLKTHMKLHENKREYECTLCEAAFNQKPALLSHLKTKHKIISASKE